MTLLSLCGVSHAYGARRTLDNVSLDVGTGEIVAILGPSGCGKSTLLRIIAGLEEVLAGEVRLDGAIVSRRGATLAPERRGVGLVFQDFALFPHLSVQDNVLFGLRPGLFGRPVAREAELARALSLLERVGMAGRASSFPHALSGGQQQRVAVARALAPGPRLLLLDEPFSGLDSALRESVRNETLDVLRESGCAALMVTHDPEEAMAIADRVVVLRDGRVEHDGPPATVYFEPRSLFVATFLGGQNVLHGTFSRMGGAPVARVDISIGAMPLDPARVGATWQEGTPLTVVVRPEGILLSEEGNVTELHGGPEFEATAVAARWVGHEVLVTLETGASGARLFARVPGPRWRKVAIAWGADKTMKLRASLVADAVHAFIRPT